MIENLSVESWEELAANASRQHEANLVRRNALIGQRAAASLSALVSGDTDAVAGIDDELCGLEARIVGHSEVCRMIQRGLEAAIEIQCADATLEKIALTRASAAKRSELAHQVDDALQHLATVVCAYLDSKESTASPAKVGGDLNRAFWAVFAGTRNRPTWARRAVSDLSSPLHSMPTARKLSSTVDPAIQEADSLEAAALRRKQEAVAALKALTPALTPVSGKSRQNRPVAAELEAA